METNPIHRVEPTVAISQNHPSTGPSVPTAALSWLAACLLILLGVAFGLGMLGFGPYNPSDAWLFSVVGKNVWLALTNLAVPEMPELVKIWPLILVSLGSAILLIARRWSRLSPMTAAGSGRKENHAN